MSLYHADNFHQVNLRSLYDTIHWIRRHAMYNVANHLIQIPAFRRHGLLWEKLTIVMSFTTDNPRVHYAAFTLSSPGRCLILPFTWCITRLACWEELVNWYFLLSSPRGCGTWVQVQVRTHSTIPYPIESYLVTVVRFFYGFGCIFQLEAFAVGQRHVLSRWG